MRRLKNRRTRVRTGDFSEGPEGVKWEWDWPDFELWEWDWMYWDWDFCHWEWETEHHDGNGICFLECIFGIFYSTIFRFFFNFLFFYLTVFMFCVFLFLFRQSVFFSDLMYANKAIL